MIAAIEHWLAQRDFSDWLLLWALGVGGSSIAAISAILRDDKSDPLVTLIHWTNSKPWSLRRQVWMILPVLIVGVWLWPTFFVVLPAYWLYRFATRKRRSDHTS